MRQSIQNSQRGDRYQEPAFADAQNAVLNLNINSSTHSSLVKLPVPTGAQQNEKQLHSRQKNLDRFRDGQQRGNFKEPPREFQQVQQINDEQGLYSILQSNVDAALFMNKSATQQKYNTRGYLKQPERFKQSSHLSKGQEGVPAGSESELKIQLTKIMDNSLNLSDKHGKEQETLRHLERRFRNFQEDKERLFEQILMDKIKEIDFENQSNTLKTNGQAHYNFSQSLNQTQAINFQSKPNDQSLFIQALQNICDQQFATGQKNSFSSSLERMLPNFSPSRMQSSPILRKAAKTFKPLNNSIQGTQGLVVDERMETEQMQKLLQKFDRTFDRKVKVWQINELLSTNYENQRNDFFALKKKFS